MPAEASLNRGARREGSTGNKYRPRCNTSKPLKLMSLGGYQNIAPTRILYFLSIDAREARVQSWPMQGRSTWKIAHRCLAALLSTALGLAPGMARTSLERALGTVAEADGARLGGVSAVSGVTVHAGDVVETDSHGAMRLRLGKGQLYLSASSSASLEEHAGLASVTLAKGSASFSLPDPSEFEIETPAGTLRGSGTKATRGQVAITNAHQILVPASHGDLVLDSDGDFSTLCTR